MHGLKPLVLIGWKQCVRMGLLYVGKPMKYINSFRSLLITFYQEDFEVFIIIIVVMMMMMINDDDNDYY